MHSKLRVGAGWGLLLLVAIAGHARAQSASPSPPAADKPPAPNYDEAKVPDYQLPKVLEIGSGLFARDADDWKKWRHDRLLGLYRSYVFGHSPGRPEQMYWQVSSHESNALGGLATRKQVIIYLLGERNGPRMNLLMYLPNKAKQPPPVVLGLNFQGNHTVNADPGIALATGWLPAKAVGLVDGRATDAARGAQASRWCAEYLLSRGYALATIYYGDIEPDHFAGWREGIRGRLRPSGKIDPAPESINGSDDGGTKLWQPPMSLPTDWGAISAWAWGLSRAMDYLETDADINKKQVIVCGHSRLGKTSLWAGAQDERFAIVISNDSGEGGAAISRRLYGERVADLNRSFPHWFCGNFKQYSGHEEKLPVDAHQLIALSAPRPLYVGSAIEDRWADPRGEFLAALAAEPVYQLFGLPGLGVKDWPPVDTPVGKTIGYHVRTGKHDVLQYDWEQYLNFADRHFGRN